MACAQSELNAAERENHDQSKGEKNDKRTDEPGRCRSAPAPFPTAHASAGRIGEALAHGRGARCGVLFSAGHVMLRRVMRGAPKSHMKYTRRRAIRLQGRAVPSHASAD